MSLYTDEASFVAAVGAHDLETFESTPLGSYGTSATFGVLTFDSSPSSRLDIRTTGAYGAHNTTPGGARFLEAAASGGFHDPMHMGRTDGMMRAWGANFTDLDYGTISFYVDGQLIHSPAPAPDAATTFVGFIGPMDFVEVRLDVNDNTYGIDDVRTAAAIPEPITMLAVSLAVGALGRYVGRRRIASA